MKKSKWKEGQKGSFTIEASVMVPMICMVLLLILYVIFYYHDKNILSGATYETAVWASGRKNYEEEEIKSYFQKRIRGKLILFGSVQEEIQVEKEEIRISCVARKKRMKVTAQAAAKRTEPEKFIRNVRKLEKLEESLKKKEIENTK